MNLDTVGLLQFTASTLKSYFPSMNRRDKNFNTILSGADEIAHNIAAATQRSNNSDHDYDTRGYFQQYGSFHSTGIGRNNGHLTDEYKKWKHPTQSAGSRLYAGGYKAVNWSKEPYRTLGSDDTKSSVNSTIKNMTYKNYGIFKAVL
jgi:hypothetical protein